VASAADIRKRLDRLLLNAREFLKVKEDPKSGSLARDGPFKSRLGLSLGYQEWYTEALATVRQLAPDRLAEFEELYSGEAAARQKLDATVAFSIRHYLSGLRVRMPPGEAAADHAGLFRARASQQLAILASLSVRLDSALADIRGLVQAELLDNEIDAARVLAKARHLRAAGVVAGVVLERHLAAVCDRHQVPVRKGRPTLSDYFDLLKGADVIDTPTWRRLQHLGDIRNVCCHAKERDPKPEEVEDLVEGVEKTTKTLF